MTRGSGLIASRLVLERHGSDGAARVGYFQMMGTQAGAAVPPTTGEPERIGFLLVPGFTLMAFTSAIEPLRLANLLTGRECYRCVLLSRDGGQEVSSGGVPVAVQHAIDDAPSLRAIVVCGGLGSHWYTDRKVLSWLRRLAAGGATLGSICTGSHILARAGLLEGYRCTIHWENLAGFVEAFPQVNATGELFTIDRKRFTCAGGTVAVDLMLHRIAQRHGDALAVEIAEQLLHDRIRPGAARQHAAIQPDPRINRDEVVRALAIMEETLEAPRPIGEIAARTGTSRRKLERLFLQSFACPPARYYMRMRLRRARHLLAQTEMSITEIALACGFVSATHFSKAYRAILGASPRQDRYAQQRSRAGPIGRDSSKGDHE